MLIGYARVSTDDQNLDLQRDALQKAGCTEIYEDRLSGRSAARPGLQKALEVLLIITSKPGIMTLIHSGNQVRLFVFKPPIVTNVGNLT